MKGVLWFSNALAFRGPKLLKQQMFEPLWNCSIGQPPSFYHSMFI